jgi:hypothetical protein
LAWDCDSNKVRNWAREIDIDRDSNVDDLLLVKDKISWTTRIEISNLSLATVKPYLKSIKEKHTLSFEHSDIFRARISSYSRNNRIYMRLELKAKFIDKYTDSKGLYPVNGGALVLITWNDKRMQYLLQDCSWQLELNYNRNNDIEIESYGDQEHEIVILKVVNVIYKKGDDVEYEGPTKYINVNYMDQSL